MRLIWIVPKFPVGEPDGARHATSQLIRHLSERGLRIDLLAMPFLEETTDTRAAQAQLGVASCSFVRRQRSLSFRHLNFKIPWTFRTFTTPVVRHVLNKKLAELFEDSDHSEKRVVVFDGLHPLAAFSPQELQDLQANAQAVIYRAHNVETTLWEQCAEKARLPWMRWLFRYQANRVRAFEKRVAQTVSWVAPVSDEDAARFKILAPAGFVSPVPIGMDFFDEENVPLVDVRAKTFEVLFVGRLDWLPNRQGLSWFLKTIWPEVVQKRPEAVLKIAGVGDGEWLQYHPRVGVQFLGRVENVDPLYRACALTIAPLFQGSGTRVKILESCRYARPVLSTTLGVEGLGLIPEISYYRANRHTEWLSLLSSLTLEECQRTGQNAFWDARRRFDGKEIAERFIKTLADLTSNGRADLSPHPREEDLHVLSL